MEHTLVDVERGSRGVESAWSEGHGSHRPRESAR